MGWRICVVEVSFPLIRLLAYLFGLEYTVNEIFDLFLYLYLVLPKE